MAVKDIISNLKLLNAWFFNPKALKPKIDKIENAYIYRMMNYCLGHPQLVRYLNKYLNSMDNFGNYLKEDEFNNWLTTFQILFKSFDIKSPRDFYYSKFNSLQRNSFSKIIYEYINTIDKSIYLNQDEINMLYVLFEKGIISPEIIENLTEMLSEKTSRNNNSIINDLPKVEIKPVIKHLNINGHLSTFITNRTQCKNCQLYSKSKVLLDTNIENEGEHADICIIGLSPSSDDIKNQLIFSDQNNGVIRVYVNELIDKYSIKVLYINLITCFTNDTENLKNIYTNCKGISDQIFNIFKPKLKLVVGYKTAQLMGFKGTQTKIINSKINDCFIINSVSDFNGNATPKNIEKFKLGFRLLDDYISKNLNNKKEEKFVEFKPQNNNFNLEDCTLFNINIVEDNIIYIFIDSNGDKRYVIEKVNYPIYIKDGDMKSCNYIETEVDSVCFLTSKQKRQLAYQLNGNLKQMVE
jgi:uracil-DNA glycosylase